MTESIELDFLGVETAKSGDAIAVRHTINGRSSIHVIDGGYLETGERLVEHVAEFFGTTAIDHVVLTHPDSDHANGLRRVIENCQVGCLWMNRPWIYAEELIPRFATYNSPDALRRRLRQAYAAAAELEELATEKGIPIRSPLQGEYIGQFRVLAPSRNRYLDLVVDSAKTPDVVLERSFLDAAVERLALIARAAKNVIAGLWGEEHFPVSGTSAENEMSVIQTVVIDGKRVLLTGDAGRDALKEAADYLEAGGGTLPGVWAFQVPHHGGRHNVDTEVLNRWLGKPLASAPDVCEWNAVCSSAKADEDHPRKVVVRAMIHRGAHFAATEGRTLNLSIGARRDGWSAIAQSPYPSDYEGD